MSVKFKKLIPFINALLIVLFLVGTYIIYKKEVSIIKENIHNRLYLSLDHFKEYFTISQSLLFSMKYTIEDKFQIDCICINPSFENISYEEANNLYNIKDIKGIKDSSILTGIGNPNNFSTNKIEEINATLYLKPIFLAAKDVVPDLKEISYTSSNNFIYSSNKQIFKTVKDIKKQYTTKAWIESTTKSISNQDLVVTNLYRNDLDKGLQITLLLPVFDEDIFKGNVSIDVGIETIYKFMHGLDLKGETYLIDENGFIIGSQKPFKLGSRLKVNKDNIINMPVIDNQLFLVHVIDEFELRKNGFYNGSGKIFIFLLLIISSIMFIKLKVLSIKLQHQANTDSLTNLLNRRAMQFAINRQIKISRRYKEPLSFLLIDIDYFKKFNDNYGHDIGDEVLVKISNLFRYLIRSCDIASRLGGEEFLISLANTDLNEAYILAERIRKLVSEITIEQKDLNITVSIGCATLNKNDDLKSVLKRVDELMYQAKKIGRDTTVKEEEN